MCPAPARAGKMEAVIEKECSALGGLFQTIISDMKVGRRVSGCGRRCALTSPRVFASARASRPALACAVAAGHLRERSGPGVTCSPGAPLWVLLGHRADGFSWWGRGVGGERYLMVPARSRSLSQGTASSHFPGGPGPWL